MMDVLDSLSDIFDDPLLNEFTDKLISESDFSTLNVNSTNSFDQPTTVFEQNYNVDADNQLDSSYGTTLEALLKSRNPSSCVPPAPELRSDLLITPQSVSRLIQRDNIHNSHNTNHRCSSLPVIKPSPRVQCNSKASLKSGSKTRLIRDYLEHDSHPQNLSHRHPVGRSGGIPDDRNASESVNDADSSQSFSDFHSPETYQNFNDEIASLHGKGSEKNTRRAPHNAIEKRYRASINGRIDELRKILIPFPTTDAKMNKSAVLRQAIERIKELEEQNELLRAEVSTLRSLHASCGHLHHSHSSPESGIASFEPSPSSSTNVSSLDFGFATPPLQPDRGFSNCSRNPLPAVTFSEADDQSLSFLDTLDTTNNHWMTDENVPQLLEALELPNQDNLYENDGIDLLTSADTGHLFYSTSQSRSHESLSYSQLSLPVEPTMRFNENTQFANFQYAAPSDVHLGKRPQHHLESHPTKVRRQNLLVSVPTCNAARPSNLVIPDSSTLKKHVSTTFTSSVPSNSLPAVRQLLSNTNGFAPTPASATYSQPVKLDPEYVNEPAPGFNGVAARTTLCVAALCFITLDLSFLTGYNSNLGKQESPSSRRLMSSWSDFLMPSTPWNVWLVYLLQWVIATFICFWACQRRNLIPMRWSSKPNPSSVQFESTELSQHLYEAEKAGSQGFWLSASTELRSCLSTLKVPLPDPLTASRFGFRSRFLRLLRYTRILKEILLLSFFRGPRLMWTIYFRKKKVEDTQELLFGNVKHSIQQIRLQLLKIYILAAEYRPTRDTEVLQLSFLDWIELVMCCIVDFIDSSIATLTCSMRSTNPRVATRESPSELGITLSIALNNRRVFSHFPARLLLMLIRRTLQLVSTSPTGPWSQLAANPLITSMLTNHHVMSSLHTRWFPAPRTYDLQHALRTAVQLRTIDHCLRSLVREDSKHLAALEPYINILLQLNDSEFIGDTNDENSAKTTWWSQFVVTTWYYRLQSMSAQKSMKEFSSALPILNHPPQRVLECPDTGFLAESAWLSYCSLNRNQREHSSLSTNDAFCGSYRASQLLKKGLSKLSEAELSEVLLNLPKEDASLSVDSLPFWVLGFGILIADWQLSFLSPMILISRRATENGLPATFRETLSAFNTALWALSWSSSILFPTPPTWVSKKMSYSEAIVRLTFGANPVHSRQILMHTSRGATSSIGQLGLRRRDQELSMFSQEPTQTSHPSTSNIPSTPARNSGLLEYHQVVLKDTSAPVKPNRCVLLTQSPGQ